MAVTPVLKDLAFRVLHGFRGVPVRILGGRFRLDESLRRWRSEGEEQVLGTIDRILGAGDTFVDVGANFGLHTLVGGGKVGPRGKVVAIEPVPANLALLRRNVRLNGMADRVTIVDRAATDVPGRRLALHHVREGVSVAASLRPVTAEGHSIEVEATTLDECLAGERAIRLVKIDVEGAEHLVLRGAKRVLGELRPALLIEVHEFALPAYGTSAGAIRVELRAYGYREQVIDVIEGAEGRYFHALYST